MATTNALPSLGSRRFCRQGAGGEFAWKKEWGWQYVFPSKQLSTDQRSGKVRRHHVTDIVLQKAVRQAVQSAEIAKPASVHTLRHSFATHLLLQGVDIRHKGSWRAWSGRDDLAVFDEDVVETYCVTRRGVFADVGPAFQPGQVPDAAA